MIKYLAFALLVTAVVTEFTYDSDVLVLDENNIEEAKNSFEYLLLEFYAPWCGHCQKLAPEYSQAAKDLKEEGIVLAKIDATVQKKLAEKYSVNGYPTLKFITQGKQMDFDGGRTTDGIKQWIFSHINPGSEQIDTLNQLEDAIEKNRALFFYFADDQPKDTKDRDFRRYKEFSYTIKATAFAHTHAAGIREHYKLPKTAKFVVFKNGKVYTYSRPLKLPEMKAFVEINSFDRVVRLSDSFDLVNEKLFQKERPVLFYFTQGKTDQDEAFANAREEFPSEDYLLFVRVSENDVRKDDLIDKLQIKESDAEGVFLVAKKGSAKFRLQQQITKESVLNFISDWKDGKANRYLRSQDAPKEAEGPIRPLVGSTYYSDVLNGNGDVIVLYYSSALAEHQGVQKQFEVIAERLKNNNILFAKIDCSENEVPDMTENIDITKIRYYKGASDSRQQVKFVLRANKLQEERLVKWVKENASGPFNDPKGEL